MFFFFLFVFLMTWLFAHAFFVLFAGFQAECACIVCGVVRVIGVVYVCVYVCVCVQ